MFSTNVINRPSAVIARMVCTVLILAGLLASSAEETPLEQARLAAASSTTAVSLQFDDGAADQAVVRSMLAARGMKATFYVNSGRIGQSGYLTHAQLTDLQADGNEIGGHTVGHADLPTLDVEEQKRQVCNDRVALADKGFRVESFAYPYGSYNSAVKAVVGDCGYNSARTVGGIASPDSCTGCPYAETIPPKDPYATRTPVSVKSTTTLADLKKTVIDAESNGGGWVQFVMHHVCTASPCDKLSVGASTLSDFLDWLASRSTNGTVVRTVAEVVGGSVQPAVLGPPPPAPGSGSNLLKNPSLEESADGVRPTCWTLGGFGTNTAFFTRTNDAHTGNFAQRVDVTNYSDGDRKVVVMQDLGACAPSVRPGQSYVVSNWYKSTIHPRLVAYYRNTAGGWQFWYQSPKAELPSAEWAQATWTTPPVPADATALSIGMSIRAVGHLTVDDFGLADADQTPPTATLTAPAEATTVAGIVDLSADASDNVAVDRVDFLVNGAAVSSATAAPYVETWDSKSVPDGTVSIAARAVDTAGNTRTSQSHLVTVGNNPPPVDSTPPEVAIACNGTACSTAPYSAAVEASLSASDTGSGVTAIRYTTDGSDPLSSTSAVSYSAPFSLGTTTTVKYTALDNAGNTAPILSQVVTVEISQADTTPPAVVISSPKDDAKVTKTVKITATATDVSGIKRVTFLLDGRQLGTVTTAPYELTWNTKKTTQGKHTLVAEAEDLAGNIARSAPVTVTVVH